MSRKCPNRHEINFIFYFSITRTIEFPCFTPVTGNRAQILYIAAYNYPRMSLPLDKIRSNPYISACAHPRTSLALSKTISNSYIVAYPCAGMYLALKQIAENSYIASCVDRRMSLLALDGIISNSYTACSKSTGAFFHDDDVEIIMLGSY
jgi:hypothetical protein